MKPRKSFFVGLLLALPLYLLAVGALDKGAWLLAGVYIGVGVLLIYIVIGVAEALTQRGP